MYLYVDSGDMQHCGPLFENHTATTNEGFIASGDSLSGSRDFKLFGQMHTLPCNVPLFLLPSDRLHIKLTKARLRFYLLNKTADSKNTFKFLDAYLLVRRV